MRIHSMVDCITNSSSTVFTFPYSSADKKVKDLFVLIEKIIKEKYGTDVDLLSELESNIVPHPDWVSDQTHDRERSIKTFENKRKKCPNMTDSEFHHLYGYLETDEEFDNYIKDIRNAHFGEEKFPYTSLSVILGGEDISKYFDLYQSEITYD